MRLRELEATAALEKMSESDAWVKSFGRTAVAPLKLGVDFVINPFDTMGRSVTGIHNMFDRAGASIAGQRSNRDSLADSLLGVSDAQRYLAVELGRRSVHAISRRWRNGCGRWPVPWPAASSR